MSRKSSGEHDFQNSLLQRLLTVFLPTEELVQLSVREDRIRKKNMTMIQKYKYIHKIKQKERLSPINN